MGQQTIGAPQQPNQQAAFGQWTPAQYGKGIPPELLAGILNNGWRSGSDDGSSGQFTVQQGQPTYNSDPNGNPLPATTTPGEIDYHPQGQGPGENYYVYDPQGKFLRTDKGSKVQSYASGVLSVAGAALGMGMVGGAAGGAAAGADAAGSGAGVTGFGDAGTMYAGSDAAAAGSLGGGASIPYAGVGAAGAAGAGGGGAAFNPAMDSQLASDQLGITGSQSAADAAAAPIPSVTVNGVPGGSSINWGDVLKTGSKVYGQLAQQNQQGQMPVYSAAQDNRPPSFVGQAPGFAPIASQPKKSPMLGGLNNPWGSPYMLGLMGGLNG